MGRAISPSFFAGLCEGHVDGQEEQSISFLEEVLAADVPVPDALMTKYHIGGEVNLRVTPGVWARVPFTTHGAALLLTELYQGTGQMEKAISVLEAVVANGGTDPITLASLAELYTGAGHWNEAIEVTEGVHNQDDPTCQALIFRAQALHSKGLREAAITCLKEALKSSKRNPELLKAARYERGLVYESLGRKAQARKDWERVFSEDSHYADVAERLGLGKSPVPSKSGEKSPSSESP